MANEPNVKSMEILQEAEILNKNATLEDIMATTAKLMEVRGDVSVQGTHTFIHPNFVYEHVE